MSFDHKAYAFEWAAFERELLPVLTQSLETDDSSPLAGFIDQHRRELSDPYEGDPLPDDWRSRLEVGDVQELADYALTRYYCPAEEFGIGDCWQALSEDVSAPVAAALLGDPVGSESNRFDPGGMGAYFQTPQGVRTSLAALASVDRAGLAGYRELLERCAARQLGAYVTF